MQLTWSCIGVMSRWGKTRKQEELLPDSDWKASFTGNGKYHNLKMHCYNTVVWHCNRDFSLLNWSESALQQYYLIANRGTIMHGYLQKLSVNLLARPKLIYILIQ